jgi:soluble lytic murein transglycosylase
MAAAAWVEEPFGVADVTVEFSPQPADSPLLRRGTELYAVRLWDETRAEFDALHKQQRANPAALLQLAFYYESIGVYRSALLSATGLTFASGVPFSRVPRAVLQLAYPFYYTDLFIAEAEQFGLDPLMIAALVRQETSFDATATSIPDARGLMQLLPATAQKVANQMQLTDYALSGLHRPVVNIPLGVRYFYNMRAFQGGSVLGHCSVTTRVAARRSAGSVTLVTTLTNCTKR